MKCYNREPWVQVARRHEGTVHRKRGFCNPDLATAAHDKDRNMTLNIFRLKFSKSLVCSPKSRDAPDLNRRRS